MGFLNFFLDAPKSIRETEKNPKNPLVRAKKPKKTQKNPKNPKKPTGLGFFKKNRVFSNPGITAVNFYCHKLFQIKISNRLARLKTKILLFHFGINIS